MTPSLVNRDFSFPHHLRQLVDMAAIVRARQGHRFLLKFETQNLYDTFGGFSQIEDKTFLSWTRLETDEESRQ